MPLGVCARLKHAFLSLTDEPGECILIFTPGYTDWFFAEFGQSSAASTVHRTRS